MSIDVNRTNANDTFGPNGASSCSFTVPESVQPNDLFLVFVGAGCDPTGTPFEGHAPINVSSIASWVQIAADGIEYDAVGGGTGLLSALWWAKGLAADEVVTIDTGADLSVFSVSVARISGTGVSPINAVGSYGVGTNASPSVSTAPSITVTADDVLLLYFIAATHQLDDFQTCAPTGFVRAQYMQCNLTTFESATIFAIKGADIGPTGAVASQPITKDGVYVFNPRPLSVLVAIARGGCVDGTCPFVTTDGIASGTP